VGLCEDDTPEQRRALEKTFKKLSSTNYRVTSNAASYNCLAYAAGDTRVPWDPIGEPFAYWPRRVPKNRKPSTIKLIFARQGFKPRADGSLDPAFEKVAILSVSENEYGHVAIQLPNGSWSSKLGRL